ncbi:serine/threonine-protein kinase Nek3 [Melanerpes formicivorus]|uniref:serine/threonine-protein kinase Nek3 n=1 Tax=Melanerpes formicivorus TaxID=211600 RepID=UPI00358FDCBC
MEEYKVLEVLGEGSFGRALLVQHRISEQKYAMKEIRLPMSSADVENSRKEAVLLAKMKHPNIVAYQESFEADGHLYIVMEYCDDGDLMQKIKHQRGKLFPEDTILHWFVQMCLGVKHIHDKRVLHRDIKSKNVFLTQNGKVKLGDFGSARLLAHPASYACSYVGTPYYVPPEVWESLPYNNKSDIWSLGCILYELCTLKHPFQANSWKHLILKICKGAYSPLPSHYSYELHYLVKQMFKRNPKSRPSASTLLARGCLSRLTGACLPPEPSKDESKHSPLERKNAAKDLSESRKEQKKPDEEGAADSSPPQRRQWGKRLSSTVVDVLGNAPLLSSSFTSEETQGGCVISYSGNKPRKHWNKEAAESVISILSNADVSLAFQTYTIYKPASGNVLRGPLCEGAAAPDETDGEDEAVAADSGRLEPRSDEDDTDFEEDDPDWVSELETALKQ